MSGHKREFGRNSEIKAALKSHSMISHLGNGAVGTVAHASESSLKKMLNFTLTSMEKLPVEHETKKSKDIFQY